MCYTKEVSRNAFIINIISCYILYNYHSNQNSHKIFSLFFVFVGLMQLYDWIFWENQTKNNINYITTKVAMISNHLQPIILACLLYYFNGNLTINSKIILTIYIVTILYYSINIYNKIDYTLVSYRSKPSLDWQWNSQSNSVIIYTIFLLTFIILSFENIVYPMNLFLTFLCIMSFTLASYYYKGINVGRLWCNYSSYIPLLILLVNSKLNNL